MSRLEKRNLHPSRLNKKNYDVIFHTASLYDYNAPYELLHKINYEGLQNLLQVLSDYTEESKTPFPRFIHWSTCGVYGEPNYPKDEKGFIYPVNEDTPFNPPNDYSKTKVEQEKLLINFSEKNEKFYYNILRPAPIYGPYQTYGMYHIFYSSYTTGHMIVAKIFPKRKKLFMPFIHVKDLAKAALFIAECEEGTSQVFNIINDSILQEDWEEFLYNELGISFSTVPIPWFLFKIIANFELVIAKFKAKRAKKRGYRPKFDIPMVEYLTHQYYFSNKKLKDLGFEFEYNDFKKGIKETVRWYKDNKWFPSFEPLEFLQNKILKNQEEAI
ncbi:MAG: SDR family oxidoreductase [Candidatus Lokiarchaeota archaeon]